MRWFNIWNIDTRNNKCALILSTLVETYMKHRFMLIPLSQMHKMDWKSIILHMKPSHYDDVIMTMLASQITSLTVVYSIVYSGVNQRKHQSSASLAFVREIHRGPVNFPYKWPVTRKMFPFDDVIMMFRVHTHLTWPSTSLSFPVVLP